MIAALSGNRILKYRRINRYLSIDYLWTSDDDVAVVQSDCREPEFIFTYLKSCVVACNYYNVNYTKFQ